MTNAIALTHTVNVLENLIAFSKIVVVNTHIYIAHFLLATNCSCSLELLCIHPI